MKLKKKIFPLRIICPHCEEELIIIDEYGIASWEKNVKPRVLLPQTSLRKKKK